MGLLGGGGRTRGTQIGEPVASLGCVGTRVRVGWLAGKAGGSASWAPMDPGFRRRDDGGAPAMPSLRGLFAWQARRAEMAVGAARQLPT